MKMTTLCYIEKDGKYLMLHRTKKQHDINKDKWIGVGGHAEGTEGPEDCLLREVKEETGLTLTSYQFRGLITFISDEAPEPEEMCLFTADGFTGELIECNEGDLQWMDKKEVLALPTWEGDAIFLKLLIEEDVVAMCIISHIHHLHLTDFMNRISIVTIIEDRRQDKD